jgi:hypothetical protein
MGVRASWSVLERSRGIGLADPLPIRCRSVAEPLPICRAVADLPSRCRSAEPLPICRADCEKLPLTGDLGRPILTSHSTEMLPCTKLSRSANSTARLKSLSAPSATRRLLMPIISKWRRNASTSTQSKWM